MGPFLNELMKRRRSGRDKVPGEREGVWERENRNMSMSVLVSWLASLVWPGNGWVFLIRRT